MRHLVKATGLLVLLAGHSLRIAADESRADAGIDIPSGAAQVTMELNGHSLDVFTFKPDSYRGERMIIVMHGVLRNADVYRDHAREMGQRARALIIAPRFDAENFPSRKYQRGGILTEERRPAPAGEWTYQFIPAIAEAVRQVEDQPELPFWVIGHSAGGQFVERMAAFLETGAERLVAANPGSHLFPARDLPFGYGFGDLPDELGGDDRIRQYLAAPLTLYLGTEDNQPDEHLDRSTFATQQGEGRYQRGRACFELARRVAQGLNCNFGWRLVEAPGVAHDHEAMFNHQACDVALFGGVPAAAAQEPAAYKGLREINPPREPPPQQAVAITGARLIDGRGGPPVEDALVVIRGSKIVAVGSRHTVVIPDEATRIDATGLSLLPGLLDSHFHSRDDIVRPVEFELNHGITAFRDPGHPFRFYDALRRTDRPMPRVFLCGAHLDADPPAWPDQAIVIRDAQHARRTVTDHVAGGASAIKVYMRLPLEHIAAVCSQAATHSVPVTAHLELVDADQALRAGVRGIEHVTSFGTSLADPEVAERFRKEVTADSNARKQLRHWLWSTIDLDSSPRTQPLIDLIVDRQVFVSPTLAIFERRPGDEQASGVDIDGFANMLRFVGLCHEAGARVVVGSHTQAPHAERGWAYQRELELLVEAGFTPLEAITAGTWQNAQFLGAQDRLGTIEPGKLADLLLVGGDPSRDIADMRQVRYVMLNGIWQGTPPGSIAPLP